MNTIKFFYEGKLAQYSTVQRCIFTGVPKLWLIVSSAPKLLTIKRGLSIIITGSQASGKTFYAELLKKEFAKVNIKAEVFDEIASERRFSDLVYVNNMKKETMSGIVPDVHIYCFQNESEIPAYLYLTKSMEIFTIQ